MRREYLGPNIGPVGTVFAPDKYVPCGTSRLVSRAALWSSKPRYSTYARGINSVNDALVSLSRSRRLPNQVELVVLAFERIQKRVDDVLGDQAFCDVERAELFHMAV